MLEGYWLSGNKSSSASEEGPLALLSVIFSQQLNQTSDTLSLVFPITFLNDFPPLITLISLSVEKYSLNVPLPFPRTTQILSFLRVWFLPLWHSSFLELSYSQILWSYLSVRLHFFSYTLQRIFTLTSLICPLDFQETMFSLFFSASPCHLFSL